MTSDAVRAEVDRQIGIVREGAVDFYGEEELRARLARALAGDRPLRVKLGMDPSSPDLHIGHLVQLERLRRFQELGHLPIFLVGDFTAQIGDPSGRNKARPPLSREDVQRNAATYVEQVGRVLPVERAEVRFNSEWMESFPAAEWIRLCASTTLARMLERDDFAKRFAGEVPIYLHELLYPLVQAYDSVALEADVELGGTDQTFNLLMGRELQRDHGQAPQAVLTAPLLVGTDGSEKMSKSLGNHIAITDPPEDVYGKVMSVPDALLDHYVEVLGFGEWDDLSGAAARDPMAVKQQLASRIVERLHGGAAADEARAHFARVVQRKELPADIEEQALADVPEDGLSLLEVLERLGWIGSRSEGRRLIAQGGVRIERDRVEDPTIRYPVGASFLIQAGKRRFARVVLGPDPKGLGAEAAPPKGKA